MSIFTGIIPPAITPFNADGSVDEKGYAVVLEHMIDKGVHALIIGGTTGEYYAMNREERISQFKLAAKIINGRVPMICGVNDITTDLAIELAVEAGKAGADGILVAAPYYSLPTEKELAAHCLAVDRAADLPIMLYNYPGRTGVNMGNEFLDRVGQRPNFASIKEASGDVNRIFTLVREYAHIELSCGAEEQALDFFVWGATSWVTPMGNFFPEEVVALYDLCTQKHDYVTARKVMMALLPVAGALEQGGKFLQCTKYACEYYGLPTGPVRQPMRPIKKELAREMRNALTTAKSAIAQALSETQSTSQLKVVNV